MAEDFVTKAVKRGVSNAIASTVKTGLTNGAKKLTGGAQTTSTRTTSTRKSSSRAKAEPKGWQCPLCMNMCDESAAFCCGCGASRAAIQAAAVNSATQAVTPQPAAPVSPMAAAAPMTGAAVAAQAAAPAAPQPAAPMYQQVVLPDGSIAYQQVQQQPVYQQVLMADGSIAYMQIDPSQIIPAAPVAMQAPVAGASPVAPQPAATPVAPQPAATPVAPQAPVQGVNATTGEPVYTYQP